MEQKDLISNEVITPAVNIKKETASIEESIPKKSKNNFKNSGFKTKECEVIFYNERLHALDVRFDGYGIRIKDIKDFTGSTAIVKYKGKIGHPNFEYKL